MRHQPTGIHWNCAWRYDGPGAFSARAIGVIDGAIAMPGPLHGRLAAGMSELDGRYCAIRLDELGDVFQRCDVRIGPDTQIAVSNASFGYDRSCFRKDQPGAAGGHLSQVHEMPVIHKTIVRTVLAHGRYDDTVFERDPAQRDRGKQKRVRCHWVPWSDRLRNWVRDSVLLRSAFSLPASAIPESGAWPCMHVVMVRPVSMIIYFNRDDVHLSVSHLAHCHQLVREFADFAGGTAQDHRFHAVVVVEVDVHRR